MIPYSSNRARRARQHHNIMHQGIHFMTDGIMSLNREGTFSEDYHNATDYWFDVEGCDEPVSVQYKVQHSTEWETWTVQVSCWHMTPDWYAFYHVHTDRMFMIRGEDLKQMSRSLYNGNGSNQPFYYGQLDDIVRNGGLGIDFSGNTIINNDTLDWW